MLPEYDRKNMKFIILIIGVFLLSCQISPPESMLYYTHKVDKIRTYKIQTQMIVDCGDVFCEDSIFYIECENGRLTKLSCWYHEYIGFNLDSIDVNQFCIDSGYDKGTIINDTCIECLKRN